MSEAIFARKIFQRREEMKLSLRKLAQITGIAASTISRIENGRLSPSLDIAAKLARALDLEVPVSSHGMAATDADTKPVGGGNEKAPEPPAPVVTYRRLGHTILRGGIRRDLSRIAARNGFEMVVLLRGNVQLRTNGGFRENLKPGATIICKHIVKQTYFAIAAEEAELLWIG